MPSGPRVNIHGCAAYLPPSLSAGAQPSKPLLGKVSVMEPTKGDPVRPQPKSDNPWNNINAEGIDEESDEEGYNHLYSEEHCLNLNVFAPKDHLIKALHLIPLMVFIYGGGFRDGSNAMALYDATNMCAQSIRLGRLVVVVNINYRLNYVGFMSSAELVEDINSDPQLSSLTSGNNNPHSKSVRNWGLLDQKLALNGCATTSTSLVATLRISPRSAKQGCTEKIPAKELVKAGDRGRVGMFTPTIDDVLIHGDSREWVHDPGRYDSGLKSIMLGNCRDEGQTFMTTLGARKLKNWPKIFARNSPPDLETYFEAIYGIPTTDGEAAKILIEVVRNTVFLYPIHATSRAVLARTGTGSVEMSRFHFDHPLKALEKMELQYLGAHHAAELLLIFGSDSALKMMTDEEQ
ncbi:hypothetical protein BGZ93_006498 [Podila epicladia]|nr:hypothetical protein BGZ93_006498 [Podila epicladia]